MKPIDTPFSDPLAALDLSRLPGRGWSVFVDALTVPVRIGIHPHEHGAPQPIVIDAHLGYGCEPREDGDWIDYDGYCTRVWRFSLASRIRACWRRWQPRSRSGRFANGRRSAC